MSGEREVGAERARAPTVNMKRTRGSTRIEHGRTRPVAEVRGRIE